MSKKKTVVIVLAVVLMAVVVVVIWPGEREPEYQGKKLSEWLKLCSPQIVGGAPADAHQVEQARAAVEQIGTNAVPWLLKWIAYEHPKWVDAGVPRNKWILRAVYSISGCRVGDEHSQLSCAGFEVLRSNALPAKDGLVALMSKPGGRYVPGYAIWALRTIGGDALQPLVTTITNRALPQGVRYSAMMHVKAWTLREGRGDKEMREATVAALAGTLSEPDPTLRGAASNALMAIVPMVLTNGVSGPH